MADIKRGNFSTGDPDKIWVRFFLTPVPTKWITGNFVRNFVGGGDAWAGVITGREQTAVRVRLTTGTIDDVVVSAGIENTTLGENSDVTAIETVIQDGDVIYGINCFQHTSGTPIMVGKTLTINGGNFVNVAKDPSWTVNGGNFGQYDFCANLHPKYVEMGMAAEPENCSHVVDVDTITIDGVVVATTYHYKDIQGGPA